MARPKKYVEPEKVRRPAARTPEERERRLELLATDLIEQRLIKGTASAQEILFYAKASSTVSTLEKEKLRLENELLKAKTDALASAKRMEEVYADALRAMRSYQGQPVDDDPYEN